MANPSAKTYVENNDFEGAAERLENTTNRWRNYWYGICEEIYNKSPEWARRYVLDPIAKAVRKIAEIISEKKKRGRPSKNDDKIIWNCPAFADGSNEKFYLIELLDKNGDLIWSKIGTTKRKLIYRMKEHLKAYEKYGVDKVRINRVYNMGFAAEGMESEFRAKYIHRWPESFQKNDRFYHRVFDLEEADKIAAAYC